MKANKGVDLSKYLIIGGMATSVLLIITVVFFSLLGTKEQAKKTGSKQEEVLTQEPEGTLDETFTTAVFMAADTVNKKITVCDVLTGESITFNYSGSTEITDKYGQIITVSQLVKGEIVKLNYITNIKRLTKLAISQDIWENIGITDVKINTEAKVISYLNKNYSYSDATMVISNGKIIKIEDLMSLDYLTIRGWEENIYSIVVTAGHGYLELSGQEQFIGGTIYVGTELMEQITEDMRLTVREGTFALTVNNQKTEGSKEIVIERDKTTICDVNEFNLEPSKTGTIVFQITPEGAALKVDQEETSYVTEVELTVGEHEVEVSLGGYVTYKGTLIVGEGTTSVTIALKENEVGTSSELDSVEDSDSESDNVGGNESGSTSEVENNPNENDSDTDEDMDDANEDNVDDTNTDSEDIVYDENEILPTGIDKKSTITIIWTSGAEVFFDGEHVGTIKNGKLTVEKHYGEILVELVIDGEEPVPYNIIVENDGEDVEFKFPE